MARYVRVNCTDPIKKLGELQNNDLDPPPGRRECSLRRLCAAQPAAIPLRSGSPEPVALYFYVHRVGSGPL